MSRGRELVSRRPIDKGEYDAWDNTTQEYLIRAFGDSSGNVFAFGRAGPSGGFFGATEEYYEGKRAEALDKQLKMLQSAIDQLTAIANLEPPTETRPARPEDPLPTLELLCNRFHLVARQLRARYNSRPTLDINDEYDVQDLLHALLRLNFDDIRPEEWTPSYAGGAARMDFLLKPQRLVVEVKKTRAGLSSRELGEQLIIDIERYRTHPECNTLVCFVYDPEDRIPNPRGLEQDLQRDEPILVRVIVSPRGT